MWEQRMGVLYPKLTLLLLMFRYDVTRSLDLMAPIAEPTACRFGLAAMLTKDANESAEVLQ